MSHVNYFICSLERDIKGLPIRRDSFINNNTLLVKFSLEGVDMLMVRFEEGGIMPSASLCSKSFYRPDFRFSTQISKKNRGIFGEMLRNYQGRI